MGWWIVGVIIVAYLITMLIAIINAEEVGEDEDI